MRGRIFRILIVILFIAIALFGLGALVLKISLDGGIANTIRNLKPEPDPTSAPMQFARGKLEEEMKSVLTNIGSVSGFTSYGDAKDDSCYRGQNTYKVTEGFAYRCTLRVTRFFGFDSDFRRTAIDLENMLIKSRWNIDSPRSRGDQMERRLIDSYDRYNRTVDRVSAPQYHRFPVQDIPDLRLAIQWAEKTTEKLYWLDDLQKINRSSFFRQSDYRGTSEILQKTTATHRYLIGIAVYGDYFAN